ncbi:hypothetical protein [Lignipirellula cremea]|uniref:Uncharacterized protein n=1 Tax=Lignipirellula cremea TaxID=2528010 RepID=A0A518E3E5_9BACT|nr:hypothetical protein [Lignipirellula cremea]QDU98610.1 hypothetical protein Pla8534_64810 [Lignipirellula cremea]
MLKCATPNRMASDKTIGEIAELRSTIAALTKQMAVMVQAIDELRDEVVFLNRNGLSSAEEFKAAAHPVGYSVRQMAADPCAADWSERLVLEPIGVAPTPPATPVEQPPPISETEREASGPGNQLGLF